MKKISANSIQNTAAQSLKKEERKENQTYSPNVSSTINLSQKKFSRFKASDYLIRDIFKDKKNDQPIELISREPKKDSSILIKIGNPTVTEVQKSKPKFFHNHSSSVGNNNKMVIANKSVLPSLAIVMTSSIN